MEPKYTLFCNGELVVAGLTLAQATNVVTFFPSPQDHFTLEGKAQVQHFDRDSKEFYVVTGEDRIY